ncbi:hypothetical protein [Rhodococcus pyridinivorans]|uniref:hypothetical protein n=1 Tax=Rhodococcus pyridinivorans TaxID=103816 RepID=UPI003AAD99F4
MREYHCTTCDFHITGPADEVADEIDAHEEQHHSSDTATKVEITPEILRDVADEARRTAHLGAHGTINALLKWADWLERQQTDEKRIDELAEIHWTAVDEAGIGGMEWGDLTPLQRAAERAGIRAVLAKLDEERDAEVYGVRDNGDVLLPATDAANVKAVLRFVFGRNNGEPYPKDAIEAIRDYFCPDPKFDQGGHTVRPLRQWDNLRDVPADVLAVCTTEGDANRDSTAPHGWRWINNTPVSEYSLTQFAPYTEIPGGDR